MKLSLSLVKSEDQKSHNEFMGNIINIYKKNASESFLFSYLGRIYTDHLKLTHFTDHSMSCNSNEGCYYFDLGNMCIPIDRCEEIYLIKRND